PRRAPCSTACRRPTLARTASASPRSARSRAAFASRIRSASCATRAKAGSAGLEDGRGLRAVKPHLSLPARSDRAGLVSVVTMGLSADGLSYAYSYYEVLSRLYLVEGLSRSSP